MQVRTLDSRQNLPSCTSTRRQSPSLQSNRTAYQVVLLQSLTLSLSQARVSYYLRTTVLGTESKWREPEQATTQQKYQQNVVIPVIRTELGRCSNVLRPFGCLKLRLRCLFIIINYYKFTSIKNLSKLHCIFFITFVIFLTSNLTAVYLQPVYWSF